MNGKCENEPYLLLMQTTKAIQEQMKKELVKNELNITEFAVLEVLYLKGKQTIQQIGISILISSGSMTYVINQLEKKGLLNRNGCPNDGRVFHVILTERGSQLMENIMPNHRDLLHGIFGSLNGDEKKIMVKLLEKVNKRAGA